MLGRFINLVDGLRIDIRFIIVKTIIKIILNLITLGALGLAIYAYFNPISRKFHFTRSDELMHVAGFAIVSCLLVFALPKLKRRYLILWLCSVGVLVELAQPLLTPRRKLSISDIAANGLGVLMGVSFSWAFIYATSQLISVVKKSASAEQ